MHHTEEILERALSRIGFGCSGRTVRLSALYHGSGTESCGTGTTHEVVEWMLSGFGH